MINLDEVPHKITQLLNDIRKMRKDHQGIARYPGYRLTERSRRTWDKIEANNEKLRREMTEAHNRQAHILAAVQAVKRLIVKSRESYKKAVEEYMEKDIKIYAKITLHWSPERVLSTYAEFQQICEYFLREEVWEQARRMLGRYEKTFISKAYEYLQKRAK